MSMRTALLIHKGLRHACVELNHITVALWPDFSSDGSSRVVGVSIHVAERIIGMDRERVRVYSTICLYIYIYIYIWLEHVEKSTAWYVTIQ